MPRPHAFRTAHAERMARLYGRQAWLFDATRAAGLFGRDRLIGLLGLRRGQRVLEVGCGTGRNLPGIAAAVGSTGRVVGVDCAPAMLARARARLRDAAGIELLELEYGQAAPPQGPFDAVVLSYTLSLVPDWRPLLELARSQLAVHGRLGVVDFLACRIAPLRALFRTHGVTFGPERRDWLCANLSARFDEERRAYGGLWRYHTFVGVEPDRSA
jgi:S-adenosylmethionine-diacylgycerolhomoserine-N-methlytransferase